MRIKPSSEAREITLAQCSVTKDDEAMSINKGLKQSFCVLLCHICVTVTEMVYVCRHLVGTSMPQTLNLKVSDEPGHNNLEFS